MQIHTSQLLAALALAPIASAVSLSDFTPRANGLPSACDKVYKATINGCQASDFTGSACSSGCIMALQTYVGVVQKACYGQQGTNIVTAFLAGQGPSQICSNAPSPLPASSSSSSTIAASSSSSSSATPSPSPAPQTSPAPTPNTDQTTSTSSSSSDNSTSQAPTPAPAQPTATSPSGGAGSPFDMGTNSKSEASFAPVKLSFALGAALAFALFAL